MGVPLGLNLGVSTLFQFMDQSVVPPVSSTGGIFAARGLVNTFEVNMDMFYYHEFQNNAVGTYEVPFEQSTPTNVRYYGTFTGELLPELSMNWLNCIGLTGAGQGILTMAFIVPLTQQTAIAGATTMSGQAGITGLKITADTTEKGRDRQMVEFRYRYNGPITTS